MLLRQRLDALLTELQERKLDNQKLAARQPSSSSVSSGGLRRSKAQTVGAVEGTAVNCTAQEGPAIRNDCGFEVSVDAGTRGLR